MLRIAFQKRWEVSRKNSAKKKFRFRDRKFSKKKFRKFWSEKSRFFEKKNSKSVNSEKVKSLRVLIFAWKTPRTLLKTIEAYFSVGHSVFLT